MRLGPLEIVIIIVIIIAIALITRIFRANRDAAAQSKKPSAEIPTWQGKARASQAHSYIKRLGIALVLAGIILLIAGISMFRWAFQTYVWSFIIVAIGFVLLFLSKKK